jgi:predicted nucleotidyltransferase
MQKSLYKYLLAGAGAALTMYGLYYLTEQTEVKPSYLNLPRESLLDLLTSLDQELTPYIITLATFSKSIQAKLGTSNILQVSEIIEKHSPIVSDIRRIEVEVCLRFNLKPDQLEDLCKTLYSQDHEIQSHFTSLKSKLNSAYLGQVPVLSSSLPEKVTPEIVLKIIKELYEVTIYMTYKHTFKIIRSGKRFSVNSPEYQEISARMHEETEKIKEKILSRYSFNDFPLPAKTILHQALQTFKTFEWFLQSLTDLEKDFQEALQSITLKTFPESEFLRLSEKFEEKLIWELESPRKVEEIEVYEYINN